MPLNSLAVRGRFFAQSQPPDERQWQLAVETPIALLVNSEAYVVMMASPHDLHDFATGFLLNEGVISSAADILGILTFNHEDYIAVDVAVDLQQEGSLSHSRTIVGSTGCGLCGKQHIADALRLPPKKLPPQNLQAASIYNAFTQLPKRQIINQENHSVHAAALCDGDGQILVIREDVGRHNALDKLIGALHRSPHPLGHVEGPCFILMSSRCSFELVQKCAYAGFSGLVTLSAPTSLALQLATKSGISLASVSAAGVMMFNEYSS